MPIHPTLLGPARVPDEATTGNGHQAARSRRSRPLQKRPPRPAGVPIPAERCTDPDEAVETGSGAVDPDPSLDVSLSDHEFVARLRRQDPAAEAAIAVLYDRYANAVYQLGRRLLRDDGAAEDLLQETFWHLWSQADRYVPGRGRFSTWLLRIATNLAIDAQRRSARRPGPARGTPSGPTEFSRNVPVPDDVEDPEPSVPDQVWHAELRGVLAAGMASLPPAQRHVVELVYFSGFTHAESAARLGAPCSTVKTRLALGLRKLALHLRAHGVTRTDGLR